MAYGHAVVTAASSRQKHVDPVHLSNVTNFIINRIPMRVGFTRQLLGSTRQVNRKQNPVPAIHAKAPGKICIQLSFHCCFFYRVPCHPCHCLSSNPHSIEINKRCRVTRPQEKLTNNMWSSAGNSWTVYDIVSFSFSFSPSSTSSFFVSASSFSVVFFLR